MVHSDLPGECEEAGQLMQEGRLMEAVACYDRALASSPDNPALLSNKAVALISLGRYEESLACSLRAIRINPYDADLWINKGIALDKLGRSTEATDALEQAVAINPCNAYARALLGIIYQNLEMTGKAEAQNRKLQELVFPREYAWFYFITATFLLGILLGGIMSVEGKPLPVTMGSAGIIILFFGVICILYVRARRLQIEIRRDVVSSPSQESGRRGRGRGSEAAALLLLVFVFIAGTGSGIAVWQYFR
ncbi:tetratricopeptide repeat protein [Methanoregula sp. PtaB.Bin085]|uniref:tetratricopeptide repeat protein n=1 Tax=Methanoregula sp. PtaB.Bin085 TaxID=1811680 RepID=UPI0009D54AE4|nr:tetratricopeptide repeat protein [Methanoregula sp. PtaB.Bin085]OPX64438.1 MAG: Tetratricopeptide repeat protein [Methanoregula sp. PtaB.Bin085]